MIRTIIVDDEPNIREGLKLIIDWEELGYKVVGEASNGREALLLIDKLNPTVVITDIKMPEISGLDLIKECRNREKKISFIILSGHSEFSMAKKALNLGASDYLLKPVDEDELTQVLIRLKKEQLVDTHIKLSGKYYLGAAFEQLLSSNEARDLTEIKTSFNIMDERIFYYIIIDTFGCSSIEILGDLIYETLNIDTPITLLPHKYGCFGLLIHSGILRKYNNSINIYLMFLISFLYKKIECEISIYLGLKKRNLYELKDSRVEAIAASAHRYYRRRGIIIDYQNSQHLKFNYDYTECIYIDTIITGVLNSDDTVIKNAINNLVEYFLEEYLSPQIIYIHLNRLLNNLLKSIKNLNGDCDKIIQTSKFITTREEQIYLHTLPLKILNLTNVTLNIIKKLKQGTNLGRKLKEYIDLNYKENLSLKCVSDSFNVNSAYLGQAFKKETGTAFNSYLHNLRLIEAAKILLNSNLKIYEIAQRIGYQDVNYFMKKFENRFNTTPKQYRKIHNKSTNL